MITDWLQQHAAILFGLTVGTIAHFGSRIARGEIPKLAYVIGFVMQLGIIGLLAASLMQWLNLGSGIWQATLTAILAMSTHEVVEWAKKQGWKRALRAFAPDLFKDDEKIGDQ